MERKFGVELEMKGITKDVALRALRAVGINVQDESYNHTARRHWKIVPDSSVNNGFEVVSPILVGEDGLTELDTVVSALDHVGGSVDRSCGYHVHFDAADLNLEHIKTIVTRYADHEVEIDAFMPISRRADNNRYCAPMASTVNNNRFKNARTIQELVSAQGGRYFKVNLQSYTRYGTVEFRQHSGTLNAKKAIMWVRFLADFINDSKQKVDNPQVSAPIISATFSQNITGILGELANMFSSETSIALTAIMAHFNWQIHSARASISRLRNAGFNISSSRRNGEQVYTLTGGYVQPANRTHSSCSALDNLYDGIAESVKLYYTNRVAALAVVA